MKKKLLVIIIAATLALAGCGAGKTDESEIISAEASTVAAKDFRTIPGKH